jgi:hypothetical protein
VTSTKIFNIKQSRVCPGLPFPNTPVREYPPGWHGTNYKGKGAKMFGLNKTKVIDKSSIIVPVMTENAFINIGDHFLCNIDYSYSYWIAGEEYEVTALDHRNEREIKIHPSKFRNVILTGLIKSNYSLIEHSYISTKKQTLAIPADFLINGRGFIQIEDHYGVRASSIRIYESNSKLISITEYFKQNPKYCPRDIQQKILDEK